MAKRFESRGQWAGFVVTQTRRGWLVERWSRIQGSRTGERVHVPFALLGPDVDLQAPSDPFGRQGDYVAAIAQMRTPGCRVLSHGIEVR